MEITLGKTYSFCQQGMRDYQEDSRFPDRDKSLDCQRFFVVCDGVGGSEKGEVASHTVCEAMAKAMDRMNLEAEFTNADFSKVLDAAYEALDRKANLQNRDMATTMAFVCFHASGCTMAHIGDSRIYHFRRHKGILYRSEDHSLVNSMVHSGMLTPEESLQSPQKHVITRYMGPVEADQNRCMATVRNTADIRSGDYILLCTDGVYNQVDDDKLTKIIFDVKLSDEKKMATLAQLCRRSADNNTAILIPVSDVKIVFRELSHQDAFVGETKKITNRDSSVEEIESFQKQNKIGIINWIKQLFT